MKQNDTVGEEHILDKKYLLQIYSFLASERHGFFSSFGNVLPLEKNEWAEKMNDKFALLRNRITYDKKACSVHRAAAFLFFHIIKSHSLVDGNKRSAVICVCAFYGNYYAAEENFLSYISTDKLYQYAKKVASHTREENDSEKIVQIENFFLNFFEE